MKSIKLLILICAATSFSQCKTIKLSKTAPFIITGATYHNWVGGQPGVSGIVDARIEERKGKKYVIANISTSNREELIIVEEGAMKKQKKEPEPIPFTLEPNEAVIKYMVGKKIYYYKVSKIKKRDTVFYQ